MSNWLPILLIFFFPFQCSKTTPKDPRVAWNDTKTLEGMYAAWQIGHDGCPLSVEELSAVAGKKGGPPKDPWANSYHIQCPSKHDLDIDVCSDGPDAKAGTTDDICNWMPQP
jgi:hypothetical protein